MAIIKNCKLSSMLFYLFCTPLFCQQFQNCTDDLFLIVCVRNSTEAVCEQQSNVTSNITGVSSLLRNLTIHPSCITMFITSGTHSLEENLNFFERNITSIAIIGEAEQLSIIECGPNAGLHFDTSGGSVVIRDVIFEKCAKLSFLPSRNLQTVRTALYFENVNVTLENVAMQNSPLGVYVYECRQMFMTNCTFVNNSIGHVESFASKDSWRLSVHVSIYKSKFVNGGAGLRIIRHVNVGVSCNIQIVDSLFHSNAGSHLYIEQEHTALAAGFIESISVLITSCLFRDAQYHSDLFALHAVQLGIPSYTLNISIFNSTISDNCCGGIFISNANSAVINRCKIYNNIGTGINLTKTFAYNSRYEISPVISHIEFYNNSRALSVGITFFLFPDRRRRKRITEDESREVLIKNCSFNEHHLGLKESSVIDLYDALPRNVRLDAYSIEVRIENCQFKNNYMETSTTADILHRSVLHVFRLSVVIKNTSFINNTYTGILLTSTALKVQGQLSFIKNYAELGGGISATDSLVTIDYNASVHAFQNRATKGGFVYINETCDKQRRKECFFQFEFFQTSFPTFTFEGNRADKGGDIIFGSCLSGCLQKSGEVINLNNASDIFWQLVSLPQEDNSQSKFAEHPYKVKFCDNSDKLTCTDDHQVMVYRGATIEVDMMVTGDLCSPSFNIIHASIPQGLGKGVEIARGGSFQQANPSCERYSYTLKGGHGNESNFTINIVLDLQEKTAGSELTYLTVQYLNQCPIGFKLNEVEDTCDCSTILQSNGVVCTEGNYSFNVPALTWIGMWQDEVAVGTPCQYCKASGLQNIQGVDRSDGLCTEKRRGTLCGGCFKGYSTKLGGYQCGDCSKHSYKGYVLTLSFMLIGILLVFILLKFNITVSTGLINGLIFYSNIIYSSHNIFLPLNRDTSREHLNNMVHFLFVFKAWLNLDFGIDVCFFHGTDTYTVTWLQFVFPLYIWFLIFAIAIVSRYSSRVSKFTGHNTISVLATLLLLSYTKLLLAVLSSLSYTRLQLDDNMMSIPLWFPDPNIKYGSGKHFWLLLMSIVIILLYILPFTFLVTFGPFLISKSGYKILRWIHKVRPFLDAFYGPYTRTYYYWPGILLLLRAILVCIIAFYSTGEGSLILLSITISLIFLILLWQLMGKTHQVSFHRKKKLNLLELFFILNLVSFAVISLYLSLKYPKDIHKQQVLAVVMCGSVFALSCCIVAYHIFSAVRPVIKNIATAITSRKKETVGVVQQEPLDIDSIGTYYDNRTDKKPATQTELELPKRNKDTATNELREPLLEICKD